MIQAHLREEEKKILVSKSRENRQMPNQDSSTPWALPYVARLMVGRSTMVISGVSIPPCTVYVHVLVVVGSSRSWCCPTDKNATFSSHIFAWAA